MTADDLEPIRWGVIGATSMVARLAVLPAIEKSEVSRLVASASGLENYQGVLEDPRVEAVYVPLPNGLHAEWTSRAAAAGKHVLCEKPLSVDPQEAAAMATRCNEAGVVLAEAYMTPFHPRSAVLAALVADGGLGELRTARAAFSFPHPDPSDHRFDPLLGGGALADVGIYCLAPIFAAAGHLPLTLAAAGSFSDRGIDTSLSAWMDFGSGFSASVECSFEAPERQLLEFVGTEAWVSVKRAFTPGEEDTSLDVIYRDGSVSHIETGGGDPYLHMVDDFAAVVRGRTRPQRTNADAVALLEVARSLRGAALNRS